MLADKLSVGDFGEVFPRMEHILRCGFFVYSYVKKATYLSPGMYYLMGLEMGSVDGTSENFIQYVLPEDRDGLLAVVKRARDEGKSYDIEFSILDARGIYRRLHAATDIRRDGEGKLVEYGGVMRDVTENYFYKKALEQKVSQLDKSNRNLQEFVYVASHDLQEPLRKISTFSERLKSRYSTALGDEGAMYLTRIMNSTGNMQSLLEDLLSFSRLASTPVTFEQVELRDVISAAMAELEIKIEQSGAEISASALPEIDGYPSQLRQLFSNLISNAIKFRKADERPRIAISSSDISARELPGFELNPSIAYKRIDVRDNGIGFEDEFKEKIFHIFQRLNGKAEYPGSGIGLSICKRIAENHRGVIFAKSAPGEGATFTLVLPVKQT